MIFEAEPKNFINKHEIVSCFCEYNNEVLFLLRADHRSEGNKWGPPAGKVDPGETILEAIEREVFEETGIDLPGKNFEHLKCLYIRYPDYDFIYHVFRARLTEKPKIKISVKEHKGHKWTPLPPNDEMEFVLEQDNINNLFYGNFREASA